MVGLMASSFGVSTLMEWIWTVTEQKDAKIRHDLIEIFKCGDDIG